MAEDEDSEIVTEEELAREAGSSPGQGPPPDVVDRLRDEYWEGLREPPQDEAPLEVVSLVQVRLDEAPYAFELAYCRSILRAPPLTRIPRCPPELLGMLAYRGEVFPVLDLRKVLGLPPREPGRRSRVVLLATPVCTGAVLVDRVDRIEEVPGPLPPVLAGELAVQVPGTDVGTLLSVPGLLEQVLLRIQPQEVA